MSTTIAHSTPYDWPFDGRLDLARLCLVVISAADASCAAVDGSVAGPPAGASAALARVGELIERVESVGGVVLQVGTTPPNGPHRVGGRGVARAAVSAAKEVQSHGVDGFYASALDTVLRARGLDQLLLCGQWLETSVHSTMRSANDRGFECLLVLDACVPLDAELVPAARSQIEMSGGIFGAVGETADVLAALSTLATEPAVIAAMERTP